MYLLDNMEVNNNVFYILIINIVIESHGLEVYPLVTENIILQTASLIRNTTNELFLAFKLKGIKSSPKLRQYSSIHYFFSTLTLKDHDTLNQISIASRVDTTDINNETQVFMDAINELLNENPIKNEESNKDYLRDHVSQFLTKLEYLKDSNGVNDNNFNINSQILSILGNEDRYNLTQDEEANENNSLLSDAEFWVPEKSGRRIYQGDKTKIKYFPFMASIQIFNSFQCGGCIIKSDLVITAASCLQLAWNNRFFRENPAFLTVRVGSDFYRVGGESIDVLEVYFHPDYNPKTLKNNICLLRLIRRIKFRKKSKGIKKIDFDRNPSNLPLTTDGITIVGWGAKGRSNIIRDPWAHALSFAVLDIYPQRECQDIYSRQYVTQKNFCAGFFSKGGGACNGDVGGPGIVNGVLAGIVSFGSPVCGTPDAPTVFTKLGYYADWIESIMEQDVPYLHQKSTLRTTPQPITMPRYHTNKPTTFVVEPVGADWKPPRLNGPESESLRMLDDENLFKQFLATMFGSKEAKEYEELFVNKPTEKKKHIKRQKEKEPQKIKTKKRKERKMLTKNDEKIEIITKSYEHPPYHFTALDNMFEDSKESIEAASEDDHQIESNILKLIENIDVSDKETKTEIEKEKSDFSENDVLELVLNDEINIPREVKSNNIDVKTKNIDVKSKNIEDKSNNIDDSILTLLYLSDSEKNPDNIEAISNVIDDFDEHVNEGLSISMDGFKDLTFRDNGSGSFYNFLPKEEMYELLGEAIDHVAQNKNK